MTPIEPTQRDIEVSTHAYWESEHGEKPKSIMKYRLELTQPLQAKLDAALKVIDDAEKAMFGGVTVCRMCSVNTTAYENDIQRALSSIRTFKSTYGPQNPAK